MTTTVEQRKEAALLSKLQSQFGDMDLGNLLLLNEEEKKEVGYEYESEESSVADPDPTPEELKAWQEEQFKKGQQELQIKKQIKMTPLQRRRDLKKRYQHDQDEEDWEQVAALPDLGGQASEFFPTSDEKGNEFLGVHPLLQQFVQEGDPDILGTKWARLYSSAQGDGISFYNLLSKLKGYQGPTVMLIGSVPSATRSLSSTTADKKRTTTLGFYTTSPWTESTDMFGSSDCFLFTMDEEEDKVQFFRPIITLRNNKDKDKKHYMYCHPSSLNVTSRTASKAALMMGGSKGVATDGSVHGIGVGGTPSQPRLHLTESLEDCRAMSFCGKFESGDLLLGNGDDSLFYFDVDCLEVWGVGGDEWIQESLEAQRKGRELSEANLMRARKVDKKQFLDDFRLGLMGSQNNNGKVGTGLFDHMQHTAGR